jgi:signal transduction histidine kinase/DNA-binding response OmpR family regulator
MPSGNFTFVVRAIGAAQKWSEPFSYTFTIRPPWWRSWWALIIESLLVFAILISIVRFRERNLKQRAVMLERQVDEKTREILEQKKEVDALKSRFYTNISHEFRTPLTLILGPLEDAMKKERIEETMTKGIVKIMVNNAKRLQRLINQLLDISKIESGKMEIQLVRGDLGQFLRAIASSFLSLAESQNIEYTIRSDFPPGEFCFDVDKLEKVVGNLLSNAFKFTPSGGKVEIRYFSEKQDGDLVLKMEIQDTGKGIDADQAEQIFDRFYQASDKDSRDAEGSGIGLALTRELIELMNGAIRVESQKGEGSCFNISIPIQENPNEQKEIPVLDKEVYMSDYEVDGIEYNQPEEENTPPATRNEIILIVEDNADLRQYIRHRISGMYKVLEAANGKEGLDMALLHIPDLILTDIMMPEMDGTALCRNLKSNPLTDHIPVVMLTAKADKESILTGFDVLADDYIVKPFDSEILNARIQNLLEQRNAMCEALRKDFMKENSSEKLKQQHKSFLDEFFAIIEAQMEDPELKVEEVARKMNMSRAQFFRKSQSIAACTPHELVRMFRMKEAANLLKKGDLNVTQVMYQVGMKSLSNFAKSFRAYYGVNPSEYVSNNSN